MSAQKRKSGWARTGLRGEAGFGLVEVLISVIILGIGLVAIAGLAATVAKQTRLAARQTDQALVGQLVLERVHRQGYAAAANGTDTVTMGGTLYTVTRSVTNVSTRVKQVSAQVSGVGTLQPRTFTTRLHNPNPLPAP